MADAMDIQLESALQKLRNIAEINGYMKSAVKEELLNAVSTLEEYFRKTRENQNRVNPVNKNLSSESENEYENQTKVSPEGGDSGAAGQVALPSDRMPETSSDHQPVPTTSGETGDHNSSQTSTSTPLEEKIMNKVEIKMNHMIEIFNNNTKNVIQEEMDAICLLNTDRQRGKGFCFYLNLRL